MDIEKVKGNYQIKYEYLLEILGHFVCLLKNLYNNREVIRKMENGITRRFKINVPRIYSITLTYVEYIMRNARLKTEMGVKIVKRK